MFYRRLSRRYLLEEVITARVGFISQVVLAFAYKLQRNIVCCNYLGVIIGCPMGKVYGYVKLQHIVYRIVQAKRSPALIGMATPVVAYGIRIGIYSFHGI